jgi:hypothetical protein
MAVLQTLAQSDEIQQDWSQSQSNARRPVPVEANQWGSMAWHPISEDLTMDPVGDVSAVYNFEGTAEFGIESERFGQLTKHNSVSAQMELFS